MFKHSKILNWSRNGYKTNWSRTCLMMLVTHQTQKTKVIMAMMVMMMMMTIIMEMMIMMVTMAMSVMVMTMTVMVMTMTYLVKRDVLIFQRNFDNKMA